MEPLAAVYRVLAPGVHPNTSVAKYGYVWVKDAKSALGKVRAAMQKHETLLSVWTIDWRNPNAAYKLVFGDQNSPINVAGPEEDVASHIRKTFLRPAAEPGKKSWEHRRARIKNEIVTAASQVDAAIVVDNVLMRLQQQHNIAPATDVKPAYVPPFTIEVA